MRVVTIKYSDIAFKIIVYISNLFVGSIHYIFYKVFGKAYCLHANIFSCEINFNSNITSSQVDYYAILF